MSDEMTAAERIVARMDAMTQEQHAEGIAKARARMESRRRSPHLWRMTSQRGRECEWECHCGCGAHKTTYDGNG